MEIEVVKDSEGKYKYDLEARRAFSVTSRLLTSRGGRGITPMVRLLSIAIGTRLGSRHALSKLDSGFMSIPEETALAQD